MLSSSERLAHRSPNAREELDFYTMRKTTVPQQWTESDIARFLSLLRLCPNLEIVHYQEWANAQRTSHVFPSLLKNIAENCNSLRVLHWGAESHPSLMGDLARFLLLEKLSVDLDYVLNRHVDTGVHLPRLRTLHLIDEMGVGADPSDFVAHWDIPSIRHLILDINFEIRNAPLRFFNMFGPSLETLSIGSYCFNAPHILSLCTSLRKLEMGCRNLFGTISPHPTLSEIDLIFWMPEISAGVKPRNQGMAWLNSCMMCILDSMMSPQLKVIQVLDIGMADFEDKENFWNWRGRDGVQWQRWIDLCKKQNLRFEDGAGELLKLPRSV
jgi:hypothetical protein